MQVAVIPRLCSGSYADRALVIYMHISCYGMSSSRGCWWEQVILTRVVWFLCKLSSSSYLVSLYTTTGKLVLSTYENFSY